MAKKVKEEVLNPVEETTEVVETPEVVEEVKEEVKEEKKEEKKVDHVVVTEEYKQFSTINAPAEVKRIVDFYWVNSNDIFTNKLEEKGLNADEVKTIKEWYASLV